jgi:hypothetical protein
MCGKGSDKSINELIMKAQQKDTGKVHHILMGAAFKQAKELLMNRYSIDDFGWMEVMVETGCKFAENFSRLYTNHTTVKNFLLHQKSTGDYSNKFWQWFQYKFMQDDLAILKSSLYYEALTYTEIKDAMVGDKLLTADLLDVLDGQLIS